MSGNRGISGGTSEVLAFTEGDMLTLGVLIALGETEIDDVDIVFCALVATNEEVIRLDISVDNSLVMHFLNTGNLQKIQKMSII